MNSEKQVLTEIKKVLRNKINKDENIISLYEIMLLKSYFIQNYSAINNYVFNEDESVLKLDRFDFDNKKIILKKISPVGYYDAEYNYEINVKNNTLKFNSNELINFSYHFNQYVNEILELYLALEPLYLKTKENVNSINSKFNVTFLNSCSEINNGILINLGNLTINCDVDEDGIVYNVLSADNLDIINIISGNEEKILKRIYLSCDDVPAVNKEILLQFSSQREQFNKPLKRKLIP